MLDRYESSLVPNGKRWETCSMGPARPGWGGLTLGQPTTDLNGNLPGRGKRVNAIGLVDDTFGT